MRRFPERAPEWVIATVGNAEVCAWLGDTETARVIYDQLAPYSGLHAIGLAAAPYDGPVDLALGRLAATYGDTERARTHLTAALRALRGDARRPVAGHRARRAGAARRPGCRAARPRVGDTARHGPVADRAGRGRHRSPSPGASPRSPRWSPRG